MKKISILVLSLCLSLSVLAQKGGKKKSTTKAPTVSTADKQKAAQEKAAEEARLKEEEAVRVAKALEADEKKYLREIKADNSNPNSYRTILDKDIMFKKTVWRRLDLKEKQNKNFMSSGRDVPSLIVEYIKKGKIKAYSSDSLDNGVALTIEKFKERIKDPAAGDMGDTTGMSIEEINQLKSQNTDIDTKLLTLMDLKEDVIFDRRRSRMYYDIISLTIYIPAALNPRGFDQPVATVKYKDLAAFFKKDTRAMWFNRENDSEHRNYVDAFDLRLFSSYIVKVSNPEDELIIDTYGGDLKAGRYGSEKAAYDLMEYENNLWEF